MSEASKASQAGVLFPLEPKSGETLFGYALRVGEWNYLGQLSSTFRILGLPRGFTPDDQIALGEMADHAAISFGIPMHKMLEIWGSRGAVAGRVRLGGVWLRPKMVTTLRRRLPPGLARGESDQALWMVRSIGFCPKSWEYLVEHCPREGCARPLSWGDAFTLRLCAYCAADIGEAKPRRVPRGARPTLQWMVDLFSEDEGVVGRAFRRVPPFFVAEGPTDVFELVVALTRALGGCGRRGPLHSKADVLAAAANYVLDYPRSNWDVLRRSDEEITSFRSILGSASRQSVTESVRLNAKRILNYGSRRDGDERLPPVRGEVLNLGELSAHLGVPTPAVRAVADAGLCQGSIVQRNIRRTPLLFKRQVLEDFQQRIHERISVKEFSAHFGLPRVAVDQLLALGALRPYSDPVIDAMFDDRQLERASALRFADRLRDLEPADSDSNWLRLSDVMMGVGGREMPWGKVLLAGVTGALPGGLRRKEGSALRCRALMVHPVTAREMIMGGPIGGSRFSFAVSSYGEFYRERLSGPEARAYLSCTTQELNGLRDAALLKPVSERGLPELYQRADLEVLGGRMLSTFEIAARLGMKAKDVWERVGSPTDPVKAPHGLYERADLEPVISAQAVRYDEFEESYLCDWSSEGRA